MSPQLCYDLHGLPVSVRTAESPGSGWLRAAAAAVHSRLAGFQEPSHPGAPPHLTFDLQEASELERPLRGRTVYDPPLGEVLYDDAEDILYIEHGLRLRVLCEPRHGRASLSAREPQESDLWQVSHPLFTLPLAELLKRRGLFTVHAAGVCRNGRALVLPGTSGSGKSTLSIALVRAGFGFLGDDTLFLAQRRTGIRVLAFPDEVDLTDETVGFFPELAALLGGVRPDGWRKRQLRAEHVYGAEVTWDCAPALLVFPRVAGTAESKLTPIGRDEALFELVPNVLLTEPRSSQAHLDALSALVEASDCYRLETGRDLDGAVRQLSGLLEL